jgi:hypothetical protein
MIPQVSSRLPRCETGAFLPAGALSGFMVDIFERTLSSVNP